MLIQFLVNGFLNGIIIALTALGFAVVYNTTRIFHIAYSVLYIIAPYCVLAVSKHAGYPLWIGITAAISVTVLLSMAIQYFVYYPIEKKKGSLNVLLICSIGLMVIGINTIALIFGNETQILNPALSETYKAGGLILTHTQLMQFIIGSLVIGAFFLVLQFSQFGIKTRAMRDDPELCNIYRINLPLFKLSLYAISGLFIAIAGVLVAWDIGVDPYVGMPLLLNAVVALIIGGIGKFYAPVLGGVILGLLQSIVVWKFSANWQETVTFGILIIFLLFKPEGLFGEKRRVA